MRMHLPPHWRVTIGVLCIILGLTAFFTPLTPGSWLVFVGLELLGVRLFVKGEKEREHMHEQEKKRTNA